MSKQNQTIKPGRETVQDSTRATKVKK